MNTKLHAVTDTSGRPIRLFIAAGQVSNYTGAMALLGDLPNAEQLLTGCKSTQQDHSIGQALLQKPQPHRKNVR